MPVSIKPTTLLVLFLLGVLLTGCYIEDPGPRQATERSYSIIEFDRLEIGSGLDVNVQHGDFYSVTVSGDRRNVEDIVVEKEGSTLVIRYRSFLRRRHDSFVEITSPVLHAVTFSGGSDSRVSGFRSEEKFNASVSGGSVCQLGIDADQINIVLSGGSYLNLHGDGEILEADVSGASVLKAFSFSASRAAIQLTGASEAQVTIDDILDANASGASHLVYRGAPSLAVDVSGASAVHHE